MSNYELLTDESLMPYGKYEGKRMIDVPASYLIWLHDNKKCSGSVQNYIVDNLQVLQSQTKK